VFACGISINQDNLPINIFPEAKNWIPPSKNVFNDFIEGLTGMHLLMLRTREFLSFWNFKNKNSFKFIDASFHFYCYNFVKKRWARTKKSQAIHLTWNRYNESNYPITKLKRKKTYKDIWIHNRYCSFKIYYLNNNDCLYVQYYFVVFYKLSKFFKFLNRKLKINELFQEKFLNQFLLLTKIKKKLNQFIFNCFKFKIL